MYLFPDKIQDIIFFLLSFCKRLYSLKKKQNKKIYKQNNSLYQLSRREMVGQY